MCRYTNELQYIASQATPSAVTLRSRVQTVLDHMHCHLFDQFPGHSKFFKAGGLACNVEKLSGLPSIHSYFLSLSYVVHAHASETGKVCANT